MLIHKDLSPLTPDEFGANHHVDDLATPLIPHIQGTPEGQLQPRTLARGPLILIVDDDIYIGDLMKEVLEDAGYAVLVAMDAEMAFRYAARYDPDLILTDYKMPLADGITLHQRLKADQRLTLIPFALMSSRRARLPGMEGVPFLPKPFDIDDVITFVQRHVRRTQLRGNG